MDISRANLKHNIADQQVRLHQLARFAPKDRINQQMIAEDCWGLDAFSEKLERTPGADVKEIKAASDVRGDKRAAAVTYAAPALATTILVASAAAHGSILLGLGGAALTLTGGLIGRALAHKAEHDFQESVDQYSKPVGPSDFESKAEWNLSGPPRHREPSIEA